MYLKYSILILSFVLSGIVCNGVIANDFDDGISLDDELIIDDTLSSDVNFSFIKRNAISKAKTVSGANITANGAENFLDQGDLFVNSVLIDPGSVINGDITIIVNTNDTTVVNSD